jgi:hypothetical protein
MSASPGALYKAENELCYLWITHGTQISLKHARDGILFRFLKCQHSRQLYINWKSVCPFSEAISQCLARRGSFKRSYRNGCRRNKLYCRAVIWQQTQPCNIKRCRTPKLTLVINKHQSRCSREPSCFVLRHSSVTDMRLHKIISTVAEI